MRPCFDIERLGQLGDERGYFDAYFIAKEVGQTKTITSSKYMVLGTTLILSDVLPNFGNVMGLFRVN